MKRRAVPLRVSGGGVASLRELERNKRLIIVCDERSSPSNEAKEREYRATHDEYATRACGCRTATEGECGLMGLVARLG